MRWRYRHCIGDGGRMVLNHRVDVKYRECEAW